MRNCATRVVVLALAAAAVLSAAYAAERAPKGIAREVAERIKKLKPAEPPPWAKIPWVTSLLQARQLSKEEGCPVFLFSLKGNLSSGRC